MTPEILSRTRWIVEEVTRLASYFDATKPEIRESKPNRDEEWLNYIATHPNLQNSELMPLRIWGGLMDVLGSYAGAARWASHHKLTIPTHPREDTARYWWDPSERH